VTIIEERSDPFRKGCLAASLFVIRAFNCREGALAPRPIDGGFPRVIHKSSEGPARSGASANVAAVEAAYHDGLVSTCQPWAYSHSCGPNIGVFPSAILE